MQILNVDWSYLQCFQCKINVSHFTISIKFHSINKCILYNRVYCLLDFIANIQRWPTKWTEKCWKMLRAATHALNIGGIADIPLVNMSIFHCNMNFSLTIFLSLSVLNFIRLFRIFRSTDYNFIFINYKKCWYRFSWYLNEFIKCFSGNSWCRVKTIKNTLWLDKSMLLSSMLFFYFFHFYHSYIKLSIILDCCIWSDWTFIYTVEHSFHGAVTLIRWQLKTRKFLYQTS